MRNREFVTSRPHELLIRLIIHCAGLRSSAPDRRCSGDGDAAGAVDEEVRIAGRQDDRLVFGAVVVFAEVDGVLVDVVEERVRQLGPGTSV